jgi:hypothetical protein
MIENHKDKAAEQTQGPRTELTVRDVLVAARKKIERPENWSSYGSGDRDFDQHCTVMAIDRLTNIEWALRDNAIKTLKAVNGISRLAIWNDMPGRTHTEVLAVFDKAIAECGA